jgi:hypothetical protein
MAFLIYLYLAVFIIFDMVILVYGAGLVISAFGRIAPPVPSGRRLRQVFADYIADKYPDVKTIIDIGSGWGTMVRAVAKRFPNADVTGIEMMPIPYLYSILRGANMKNARIFFGDAFKFLKKTDKKFDIGITYLLSTEMKDVEKFLARFDMLLVLDFRLPDAAPVDKIKLHKDTLGQHWLYVYRK